MLTLVPSSVAIFLALGYVALLLGRGPRDRDRCTLAGVLLVCSILEAFDAAALLHPESLSGLKRGAIIAEGALPFAWGLFSLTFYRRDGLARASRVNRGIVFFATIFLLLAVALPSELLYISPDFGDERNLYLGRPGYYFYLGLLFYLVFALVQLELTYRSLSRTDRWRAKFEMVGAGSLLATMVVYYSQGLLYRSLDMNLVPVRSLALAMAVALMAYSRMRRGDGVKVRVSSEMAIRSVAILAVGLYLLGLGLVGEGMRYLGLSSQKTFLVIIAFLGGVSLLLILLSDTLRRKTRVFLHKNFFRQKYDYRCQWQQFTQWLTAARSEKETQEAILEFFSETFFVRGAALFLRESESGDFHCVALHNLSAIARPMTRDNALVRFLTDNNWVFNVFEDQARLDVLGENRELFGAQDVSFAIPLRFEGTLEGIILLCSRIDPDETLNYEDYDLMKMLARQATSTLISLRLSSRLAAEREMAAIGKVSAFVMHDLKNLVSNLALVTENAGDHLDDPEFRADMFETLGNTVLKMKGLIARLRNLEDKVELKREECDLAALVAESAGDLPIKDISLDGEPVYCSVDRVEIGKVVINLLLNGLDATGGAGPVRLEVGANDMAFIRCRDHGCGMADDFIRDRLFKPFETTKGKGLGIGLYQCRQIVEAHGGRIEVQSAPEQGSEFTVYLPLDGPVTMDGGDIQNK